MQPTGNQNDQAAPPTDPRAQGILAVQAYRVCPSVPASSKLASSLLALGSAQRLWYFSQMASLAKILSALQREISVASQKRATWGNGEELRATKVVLSLEFEIKEAANGEISFSFSRPKTTSNGVTSAPCQKLVLELEPSSGQPLAKSALRKTQKSAQPEQEFESHQAIELTGDLSALFGPPGFDSSARAMVFREAFSELSEEQTRMVIESFSGSPLPETETTAKRARSLVAKIFKSGPAKSEAKGAELLTEIYARYPMQIILRIIEQEWKTQQNWMG